MLMRDKNMEAEISDQLVEELLEFTVPAENR
jgi:hypothetical protein